MGKETTATNDVAFTLRFDIGKVQHWADKYRAAAEKMTAMESTFAYEEEVVIPIGRAAAERGFFTRDEFLIVGNWKSKRARKWRQANTADFVESVTRVALSTADERLRLNVLTLLKGVSKPSASVYLHLAHRDRYPILDFRAVWSLGGDEAPTDYSFEFWWAYTETCRALAEKAGVSMRVLDRALWQYSSEKQGR